MPVTNMGGRCFLPFFSPLLFSVRRSQSRTEANSSLFFLSPPLFSPPLRGDGRLKRRGTFLPSFPFPLLISSANRAAWSERTAFSPFGIDCAGGETPSLFLFLPFPSLLYSSFFSPREEKQKRGTVSVSGPLPLVKKKNYLRRAGWSPLLFFF